MPAGRPLELTPALIEQARSLSRNALYVETVAAQLGITSETFRDWLREGAREQRRRERGADPDPRRELHCQFSSTIKKAVADAEADFLGVIQAAGADAWQALAWILERRFPEKWATNRGELKALAKEIAALGKGAGGGVPRTTPKVRAAPAKAVAGA